MTWDERKQKVRREIESAGSVWISPYKRAQDWQAAMELVGKGIVKPDQYNMGKFYLATQRVEN